MTMRFRTWTACCHLGMNMRPQVQVTASTDPSWNPVCASPSATAAFTLETPSSAALALHSQDSGKSWWTHTRETPKEKRPIPQDFVTSSSSQNGGREAVLAQPLASLVSLLQHRCRWVLSIRPTYLVSQTYFSLFSLGLGLLYGVKKHTKYRCVVAIKVCSE